MMSAPASVVSLKDAKISAEIAANITSINAEVGDSVQKGDVLATLDCQEYDATLAQAKAGVATTKAQLLSSQSALQTQRSNIATNKATKTLYQAQAQAKKSKITQAKAQYAEGKARLSAENAKCHLANIELQRSRNLLDRQVISQQDLDRSVMEYRAAKAGCEASRAALSRIQSTIVIAQAEADAAEAQVIAQQSKVDAANSMLDVAKTNIIAAEAKVSSAEAMLITQQLMVSRCTLLAPFDGDITMRLVQKGQRIAPSETAFQLIAVKDAEVTASLSQEELSSIKKADTVHFTVTDGRDSMPIKLRAIVPIVSGEARTQEARFVFKSNNQLPIGMNGRVTWKNTSKPRGE